MPKKRSNKFSFKMVSVILGSFYHAGVCSRNHFSYVFGFNWLFDTLKVRGMAVMKTNKNGSDANGCEMKNGVINYQVI